ncbi:MAG TPA: tyrosine-type recombinase/integrase, partial [Bryobacteraceae bacterium]
MALAMYRRHRQYCKGGHAHNTRTSEYDERKKGWRRCECPIFVSGTLHNQFKRQNSGHWEWNAARALAGQFEAVGSWDSQPLSAAVPPTFLSEEQSRPKGTAIADACKLFLDELSESAAFATHKKYRLLMARLAKFSEQRGYVLIDQWEPLDVRQFRSTWPVSPQTGVRRMAMLKPFFEYCVSNKWIESNPARAVKNPKGREMTHSEHKFPFTDDEIKKMYAACPKYGGTYRHKWTGEDLSDFISLSLYTGLRISDVAVFNIERLQESGEIFLRTTKAGTQVCTWIPEWLQDRIRARAKTIGPFIFGTHKKTTIDIITETWRRRLNKLWDDCGPWKETPTPHRFRHTFARILLQRGVSVQDVADLLGNTEAVVR